MSRFCEVFHMALRSGQKIDKCLVYAGGSSTSGLILKASHKGAETVRKGDTLAGALQAFPRTFPGEFARSIANAELAGVLDEDFSRWTEYYRNSAVDSVERLAEWAPRLFYWAVLLVVGTIVVRMGMAYAGMLQGMLQWSENF